MDRNKEGLWEGLQEWKPEADAVAVDRQGYSIGRVFRFDLPMPPSANTYYRTSRNIVHLSRRGREYREEVSWISRESDRDGMPLVCRIQLVAILFFGSRRRSDIDNRIKPLLDALQHAQVFADDSQVDALTVVRGPVRKGGRCLVRVAELLSDEEQKGLFE